MSSLIKYRGARRYCLQAEQMWPSLRLRTRELDHLGPLLRFLNDDLAKILRSSVDQHPAHIVKACPDIGVGNCRIDLLVELVDDFGRRTFGSADPEPGACLIARHEVSHDRNSGQCVGTLR